jgi:hypothetical protein
MQMLRDIRDEPEPILPQAMRFGAIHALVDYEKGGVWSIDPNRDYNLVYGESGLVGASHGGDFGATFPNWPMGKIWLEQA